MCPCGTRGHGLVVTLALLGLSWTWRSFKPKEFYGSTMHFQLKVVLGIFAFISRVQKKGSFVSTIRILVAICFPSYSHHQKFISPLLSLLQDNTLFTCKDDSFQCQVYELKKNHQRTKAITITTEQHMEPVLRSRLVLSWVWIHVWHFDRWAKHIRVRCQKGEHFRIGDEACAKPEV